MSRVANALVEKAAYRELYNEIRQMWESAHSGSSRRGIFSRRLWPGISGPTPMLPEGRAVVAKATTQ